jgi:hypothetical protein
MLTIKPKPITATEYQKKMDKIIRKNLSIEDTIIELSNEGCKWEIIKEKKKVKCKR